MKWILLSIVVLITVASSSAQKTVQAQKIKADFIKNKLFFIGKVNWLMTKLRNDTRSIQAGFQTKYQTWYAGNGIYWSGTRFEKDFASEISVVDGNIKDLTEVINKMKIELNSTFLGDVTEFESQMEKIVDWKIATAACWTNNLPSFNRSKDQGLLNIYTKISDAIFNFRKELYTITVSLNDMMASIAVNVANSCGSNAKCGRNYVIIVVVRIH